jgi:hypothetical protein
VSNSGKRPKRIQKETCSQTFLFIASAGDRTGDGGLSCAGPAIQPEDSYLSPCPSAHAIMSLRTSTRVRVDLRISADVRALMMPNLRRRTETELTSHPHAVDSRVISGSWLAILLLGFPHQWLEIGVMEMRWVMWRTATHQMIGRRDSRSSLTF